MSNGWRCLRETLSWLVSVALVWTSMTTPLMAAVTPLANQPIGASGSSNVPANVMLTPSVEYPTAISQAHIGAFNVNTVYLGYFDSYKCYDYNASGYFEPKGWTSGVTVVGGAILRGGAMTCSGRWSGNFLNWATMQTIDTFRLIMTGGDRVIDTTTRTVVQKALASAQGSVSGNFEIKSISSNVSQVTPYGSGSVHIRVWGMGRVFRVGFTTAAKVQDNTKDADEIDFNAAVQVCVKSADPQLGKPMLEDNCVAYGSGANVNYKPEGLIQKNAMKMRFGVFAYLNDSSTNRDGGVLRARMKSVGPERVVPGSVNQTNVNAEWDASTGVLVGNPDPNDASSTQPAVTNSGVINYLNKFGYLTSSYKSLDNVSEMYYGAIRYLRNLGSVTEWHNNLTASTVDGFPVITNWDDPIQYKCQKNFTVGIGDVNTHRDRNVPGGTNRTGEPATIPPEVASDPVNINTVTDALGVLEGLGSNLGSTQTGATAASYYIAGVAYWAHTNDIRPDLPEKQTVDFFWVDVMEGRVYRHKNQYWLAAKYGGFIDSDGSNTPNLTSEWAANGGMYGTNPLPDNYFAASNPKAMADGLTKTFAQIESKMSRASGLAMPSPVLPATGSTYSYLPSYNPSVWIGDVVGNESSLDGAGQLVNTPRFSVQSKIEAAFSGANHSTRKVVTGWGDANDFTTYPFTGSAVPSELLSVLDADEARARQLINYLRGDRSLEGAAFRKRQALLGSVVNGDIAVVAMSNDPYDDGANPGYSAFKDSNKSRRPTVIFGANDGMIHVVNGNINDASRGGTETWAYVPRAMYANDPNFTSNGLVNFANPSYTHRYLVDGQIRVQDINFSDVSGQSRTGVTEGWNTIAVVGLGKGGKSYVALDMTSPAAHDNLSATELGRKVLWEFTDPNLGYTYGLPRVFKTRAYGWVVALPSGYNNADGKGYVFLVNPLTGAKLATLVTNAGTPNDPIGLAHAGAYIPDLGDYTADTLYAGDLKGNVWRWDLRGENSLDGQQAVRIATLTSPGGSALPITTEPEIQSTPDTQERYVFFGTGRYLEESDTIANQRQSLVALRDGNRYEPWNASTLPAGLSYPIVRGNLQQVDDLATGVVFDPNKGGWFYDLPDGQNGANERVTINPVAYGGQIVFASLVPSSDPCAPAGTTNVYALGFKTAATQLSVPRLALPGKAVKLSIANNKGVVTAVVTLSGTVGNGTSGKDFACSGDLCQVSMRSITPSMVTRLNVREVRPGL